MHNIECWVFYLLTFQSTMSYLIAVYIIVTITFFKFLENSDEEVAQFMWKLEQVLPAIEIMLFKSWAELWKIDGIFTIYIINIIQFRVVVYCIRRLFIFVGNIGSFSNRKVLSAAFILSIDLISRSLLLEKDLYDLKDMLVRIIDYVQYFSKSANERKVEIFSYPQNVRLIIFNWDLKSKIGSSRTFICSQWKNNFRA